MATYNGERFIREQLESILSQFPVECAGEKRDAEIIIADDGSTDKTLSVIESLHDRRIRVLPPGEHLGVIYNFERALREAKGEFVFLADQDDVWLPGKVSKVLENLESADLVLHDAYMLYESSGMAENPAWTRGGLLSSIRPYRSGVVANWWKNTFTGCCMAFRRKVLDRALPFPEKLPMHDQWLGLVAERYFKVAYLPEPLTEYRQHSSNATRIEKSPAGVLQKIKWRLDLAKALSSSCP